jgi:hypothetical protein
MVLYFQYIFKLIRLVQSNSCFCCPFFVTSPCFGCVVAFFAGVAVVVVAEKMTTTKAHKSVHVRVHTLEGTEGKTKTNMFKWTLDENYFSD